MADGYRDQTDGNPCLDLSQSLEVFEAIKPTCFMRPPSDILQHPKMTSPEEK